jgi:hypothetical protein
MSIRKYSDTYFDTGSVNDCMFLFCHRTNFDAAVRSPSLAALLPASGERWTAAWTFVV